MINNNPVYRAFYSPSYDTKWNKHGACFPNQKTLWLNSKLAALDAVNKWNRENPNGYRPVSIPFNPGARA